MVYSGSIKEPEFELEVEVELELELESTEGDAESSLRCVQHDKIYWIDNYTTPHYLTTTHHCHPEKAASRRAMVYSGSMRGLEPELEVEVELESTEGDAESSLRCVQHDTIYLSP
jgi:hypothetical protein